MAGACSIRIIVIRDERTATLDPGRSTPPVTFHINQLARFGRRALMCQTKKAEPKIVSVHGKSGNESLACPSETPATRGTPRACEGGERERVMGTLPAPSERPELKRKEYNILYYNV
ncbi:hypothetical protein C8J56DRAFT_898772 [Mycena floridula]|nr:hypothetical protein C8J56DRAFT_898772 [Mycena floridula]